METATGITLLFIAATSALSTQARLRHLRRGDWAMLGGVVLGAGMTAWCVVAGVWWLAGA